MSKITGIHHLALSVSDLDRSIAWYGDVLGLSVDKRWQAEGMDKAKLSDADGGLVVILVDHRAAARDGDFSERRVGLDHVGLGVADRAALEEWRDRLDAKRIPHDGIKPGSTGDLIAFRDPDDLPLEFYTVG
ncbi:MAG TPA: VOC family protein [Stackebrandtia sp.]|uniref:VOC family protein n=1 Tax=Stackebrandtia sp. TaxID=2023065 RepID=UPI002D33C309|nr:VOC family protein [Stackebrandtia sp.]HZE39818.1 VOC family protein [Stackebrandtia sp.]